MKISSSPKVRFPPQRKVVPFSVQFLPSKLDTLTEGVQTSTMYDSTDIMYVLSYSQI